jgi:hypothetical protein
MRFLNPFKKYDLEDFSGVVVPLNVAPRHPSVVAENNRRLSTASTLETGESVTEKSATNTNGGLTIASLRAEVDADISASGHNSAYDRKSKVINKAIADVGMGRYQWQLFVLCGFGWLADNLWLQDVALTLPSLSAEYGISESNVRYTTLALFTGLCIGAVFWGVMSDIIGRRLAFNMTLLITSIFGTAVGGTTSWLQACALFAALVSHHLVFARIPLWIRGLGLEDLLSLNSYHSNINVLRVAEWAEICPWTVLSFSSFCPSYAVTC